jgi:hypothetical protein
VCVHVYACVVCVCVCVCVCKVLGINKDGSYFAWYSKTIISKHFTKWTLIDSLQFYFYFVVILMYGEPTLSNETFLSLKPVI